jgi:hypothetical protein
MYAMNRKLFTVVVIALLALFLSMGGATGQGPEGEVHSQGDVSMAGTVNSRISYQGVLKEGGSPVTGRRDMTFRLYSDDTCSTQVGSDMVKTGITVTGGLFSVELDVNQSHFNGQGLWLEVEVGSTVIGCQEILPVPYALSLRPGATIGDTGSYVEMNRYYSTSFPFARYYSGLYAKCEGEAFATWHYGLWGVGSTAGVQGESASTDGVGVYGTAPNTGVEGYATADSGTAYGVYGKSDSPEGWGVYGYASAVWGGTYGVYGRSDSNNGWGVYGESRFGGVYGHATETECPISGGRGVYGRSDCLGGIGVEATSYGAEGFGVNAVAFGEDGVGVRARARGENGTGVLASAAGPNGTGIYASGDAYAAVLSGRTRTLVLEITGGSDLAEPFEITGAESIEPGMVVAIDPDHPGQLRIADKAYDRTVAGCVSGANGLNPGLTMEQEGTVAEGALPVALSGRVYCWADASYGPIQPGDLLTSSDTPGHAMRVTDYTQAQGAVIGKAMSSLKEGRGLVLILVTLQ